jgi:hypothetical protein
MIRLELLGAHTRVHATLCARCPQGPTGCCAGPPGVEWSDVGRIVSLGGLDWLLAQIASGALRPGGRGLLMKRVARQDAGAWPERCVYHGPGGCTIPAERRASTCNYYVCDDAFADGGELTGDPAATAGRRGMDTLVALYGGWDRAIAERGRARFPEGPPWDAGFLGWLGEEFERLAAGARRELRALRPRG